MIKIMDGLLSLVVLMAACAPVYFFIFRGRERGFTALASRAVQLRQSGVGTVYYLYSNGSSGSNSLPVGVNGGIGLLLSTGYLAYEQYGTLTIEFPWWDTMRPLAQYSPDTITLSFRNEYLAARPKPGITIGGQTYVVAGLNITDVAQAKRLWRIKDRAALETNRQVMVDQLQRQGFHFST